jgi:hypothetical protein
VNGQKWETITGYSPCRDPIKVAKGDKLRLESDSDLTKHKLKPKSDEMIMSAEGMVVAFFKFAAAV